MSRRENVAYDLSLFEEKEQPSYEEELRRKVKNRKEAAHRAAIKRAAASPAAVVKWVAISLALVLSLGSIMMLNVQLTELNDDVVKAQKKLVTVKSDYVRLNMDYESRMSLKNVEDQATKTLGMQKIDNYQIEYINLAGSDKVEISGGQQNPVKNFFVHLSERVMEYFR